MVSFWPFGRRDDNSPDSFERALSKLATQIQASSTQLALLRQRSRRYKAILTLYTVFGYTLYAVLVVLLVGYQNLGPKEGAGLVGGPFGIYLARKILDGYYGRRISYTELQLEALQSEQRETIEKLKAATKYSTTQSLIEKYGGVTLNNLDTKPKDVKKAPVQDQQPPRQRQPAPTQAQQQHIAPTKPNNPQEITPQKIQQNLVQQQLLAQQKAGIPPQYGQVKNVEGAQPQSIQPKSTQPQPLQMQAQAQPSSLHHLQPEEATAPSWYDRLMDVIIGEDETSARARFALICKNCRMVNGLAPPGTKDLNDMGEWGCARCGVMNGTKKAAAKKSSTRATKRKEVTGVQERFKAEPSPEAQSEDEKVDGSDEDQEEDDDKSETDQSEPEPEPPKPKSKAAKNKKKGGN